MAKPDELRAYIFENDHPRLAGELRGWMAASPRFTAFVELYRDKIRKKIRAAREPESVLDIRGELDTAYALLYDKRMAVAYEPYASAKGRGPDFAVTYRTNLIFNLEVARMRVEQAELDQGVDRARKEERMLRILLGKLSQMLPARPNLLLIHTLEEAARTIDLERLMHGVKTRAEGKDPEFYAAIRYASPAQFYKDFLRLTGVLLWAGSVQLWINKQARPSMDEKIIRRAAAVLGARPRDTASG